MRRLENVRGFFLRFVDLCTSLPSRFQYLFPRLVHPLPSPLPIVPQFLPRRRNLCPRLLQLPPCFPQLRPRFLQLPRGFLRPRLRALYRGRLQVFLVHLRRHVLGHFFQVHFIGVADLPAHRFQGRHHLLHLVPFAGVLVKHARPLLMHLFPGRVQAQGVSVIPRRNVPPSKGRLSEFLLRSVQLRRFRPLRIRQPEPPLAQVAAQICVLVVHGAVDVLALVQHVPGDGRHGLHGALALRVRPRVGHGVKGFLQVRAQVVHPHLALVLRFHLPRQRPHRLPVYRRFPVCPVPHGPQLRVQRPHQLLQPFVLLHHPLHLRHVGVHVFQRKVFVCIAIFRSFRYTVIRDVVASQGIAILQSRGNVSYFCKIVETSSSIS